MNKNDLMKLLIAFLLGYFAYQIIGKMCGGGLVEGQGNVGDGEFGTHSEGEFRYGCTKDGADVGVYAHPGNVDWDVVQDKDTSQPCSDDDECNPYAVFDGDQTAIPPPGSDGYRGRIGVCREPECERKLDTRGPASLIPVVGFLAGAAEGALELAGVNTGTCKKTSTRFTGGPGQLSPPSTARMKNWEEWDYDHELPWNCSPGFDQCKSSA